VKAVASPVLLPESVQIDLPFFAQAPDGNRDQPRQDACEEASIILAAFGLKWVPLSKDRFRSEILNLVALQNKLFGSYVDTDIAQTKELYEIYYGIGTAEIIENPTVQSLREELAAGHVVVAPFAGQLLWNIYYANGGPRYHMLVISGYNAGWFYTHDVGTRRGEAYWYSNDVLLHALHDFVPKAKWSITQGEKKVLSLSF